VGNDYTHDRIERLRSRSRPAGLGLRRACRYERVAGLPACPALRIFQACRTSRTKFRIMWLILGRSSVDVVREGRRFARRVSRFAAISVITSKSIVGRNEMGATAARTALQLDGDQKRCKRVSVWMHIETVSGRRCSRPALRPRSYGASAGVHALGNETTAISVTDAGLTQARRTSRRDAAGTTCQLRSRIEGRHWLR